MNRDLEKKRVRINFKPEIWTGSRPRVARGNQKKLIISKDKSSIDTGKDLSSKIIKIK